MGVIPTQNVRRKLFASRASPAVDRRLELWAAPAHSVPRPQGWFLSHVVAPLYASMRKEFNRKGPRNKALGHTKKCNYDDFNEFFWQSSCLNYAYYTAEEGERLTVSGTLRGVIAAGRSAGCLGGRLAHARKLTAIPSSLSVSGPDCQPGVSSSCVRSLWSYWRRRVRW